MTKGRGSSHDRRSPSSNHDYGKGSKPPGDSGDRPAFVPEAQDGGMLLTLLGSADAVGVDTYAAAEVSVRLHQRGIVTLAYGSLDFRAEARAPAGGTAFAITATDISAAGADFFLANTAHASGEGRAAGQAWATATSTTSFFALDVQGFQFSGGPVSRVTETQANLGRPGGTVQGNVAVFDVDSQTFGDNTLNDVTVSALTVEDQFSTISVQVIVAGDAAGGDAFVLGTKANNHIVTGNGSDWVFGGAGADTILAGGGDNTAFGNAGNDDIRAGDGNDWLFGGDGNDRLTLGNGDNLGFGGDGNDTIIGGSGNDAIFAGAGNDVVDAGGGDNTIRMGGGSGWFGDGNDRYSAGSGADWYLLEGAFGVDTITGFVVAQGDRLVAEAGDWDSDAGLRALNGSSTWLSRGLFDARDLIILTSATGGLSTLVLDDFFTLNQGYGSVPRFGAFNDSQALNILRDVFVDADTSAEAAMRASLFTPGDHLAFLA